jgi:hypothetical protein
MESSTTDVCEWCNRPMLPAGATVSGKAANRSGKSGQVVAAPPRPAAELEVGRPLHQQQAEPRDAGVEAESVSEPPAADVVLRPLGHATPGDKAGAPPAPSAQGAARPGVPSHGLSSQVTATSVDISQYVGNDQSIFRPLQKEAGYSSAASLDRVTHKKSAQVQAGPDWSENQRLLRCTIAGLVIAVLFAIAKHFIKGSVPDKLIVIPLGEPTEILTAVKFGIASGLMFGFMLGALLVRFQRGPFIGLIVGLVLGFSIQNGIWGYLAGALSGIVVGRYATVGVRRALDV